MSKSTEPVVRPAKSRKPVGRPPKLVSDERQEVYDALKQFIKDTDDPRITNFVSYNEVALQYNINDSNLYDWPEFSGLIKRAIKKQEDYLLEYGGSGKYNPTIAIFRLKQPQHGYTDRQQTDVTTNGKDIGPTLTPEQMRQLLELELTNANTTNQ